MLTTTSALSKAEYRNPGQYDYRVRACFKGACGLAIKTDRTWVPGVPTISGPSSSSGSHTLSWGSVVGASTYELQRRASGGSWSSLQNTSATSRYESGLSTTTWEYRVRACDGSIGCGNWSSTKTVSVTTSGGGGGGGGGSCGPWSLICEDPYLTDPGGPGSSDEGRDNAPSNGNGDPPRDDEPAPATTTDGGI